MSEVYEIADRYVLAYAALDPIEATDAGIAGHDARAHRLLPRRERGRATGSTATRSPRSRATPATTDARPHRRRRHDASGSSSRSRCTTRAKSCARCGSSAARCRRSAAASTSWRTTPKTTGRSSLATPRSGSPTRSRASRPRCAKACSAGSSSARRQALGCAEQAATWGGDDADDPAVLRRARRPATTGDADAARRARAERGRRATDAYAAARARSSATSTRRRPTRAIRSAASATRCSPACVQRHRARPRRDVRVGLGRALPHRGDDARRRGAHPPRRIRGRRSPTTSTTTRRRTDRRRRRVPAVEPGAHRPHDRRARRHALRHRASRCAGARR